MEQQTDSSAASEGADIEFSGPETFEIASDDLDELEVLYESLLMANAAAMQGEAPKGLFRIANRLKHITVRTRKLLEDL